jgi:hypothetical protein
VITEHELSSAETVRADAEPMLVIRPGLPPFGGIFDLPGQESPVVAHRPHPPGRRLAEHLHEHMPHLHISYGFTMPQQRIEMLPRKTAFEVAMYVHSDHRVDCNPIFSGKNGSEGVCVKIGGEDVHWIHSDEVGEKATRLFEATGRKLAPGGYFSGFRTATVDERQEKDFTREELFEAIGTGLVAEQHFQATWREPRDEAIEPYDVLIYLGDSATTYHTFFNLPVVVSLGAS